MIYKKFRIVCFFRIILILASLLGLMYILINTTLYTSAFLLLVVTIIQISSLLKYIDKTNQNLARFFNALDYQDYTQSFTEKKIGSAFDELNAALSEILRRFREIRGEKEEQYRYLQTVVQHVGTGLIAFQDNGQVDFINNAAKKMLGIAGLRNLNRLEDVSVELLAKLKELRPGKRELLKVTANDELLQLSIFSTELILNQKKIILVSLQNISNELDEKEMEAWQNLIRVLTHEIKNSLTPISSMAATVKGIIKDTSKSNTPLSKETNIDVLNALQTIQNRSRGLLFFVDSYRDLTHIPKANFKIVNLYEFFKQIEKIAFEQIDKKPIILRITVDPKNLEITADPELIEQVLINLIINSVQAVENLENARIDLEAHYDNRNRVVIKVSDNGPGIVKEALEKIFIPFFTTKK
ncbi:PAS domain-containing sensor histidine kinase, partial [Candidatus Zixiibacteriota bacterium]